VQAREERDDELGADLFGFRNDMGTRDVIETLRVLAAAK